MKRRYQALFLIFFIIILMSLQFVDAKINPNKTLNDKIITIDPGHGGTSYTQ